MLRLSSSEARWKIDLSISEPRYTQNYIDILMKSGIRIKSLYLKDLRLHLL